jgi:uncharacterized protein YndB with AHSA1/START domain
MTVQSPVVHSTFSIERTYPTTPFRVFAAFADPALKRRWFVEGEGWIIDAYSLDFRVGGYERSRFRFADSPPMGNDTIFLEIVPEQRIVFAYTMTRNDEPFSVSLTTIELTPNGATTNLRYTEQGAFLDGTDQSADREQGCRELLEALAETLLAG